MASRLGILELWNKTFPVENVEAANQPLSLAFRLASLSWLLVNWLIKCQYITVNEMPVYNYEESLVPPTVILFSPSALHNPWQERLGFPCLNTQPTPNEQNAHIDSLTNPITNLCNHDFQPSCCANPRRSTRLIDQPLADCQSSISWPFICHQPFIS